MANGEATPNGVLDWRSWLYRQGPQTVLLVVFSAWVANYLLLPMRDAQKQLVDSISTANQKHADAALTNAQAAITWAAAKQADAVNNASISEHMRTTTSILQQIRDDQRSGAWKHAEKGS